MLKKTVPFFLFLLALLALEASDRRFETVFDRNWKCIAFYPLGTHGFFLPEEKIHCVLALWNGGADTDAEIRFTGKDDAGNTVWEKISHERCAEKSSKRITMEIPGRTQNGYYTVNASVTAGGKKILDTQTGFIILPAAAKRDPFFAIDKNLITPKLLNGYERLGAGSLGIGINWQQPSWCKDLSYVDRALDGFFAPILKSDFKIFASVSPQVPGNAEARERLAKGLPVLTDADIAHAEKFMERFAGLTKNRIRLWIIQQEFDADFRNGKMSGGGAATLANYVTMTRTMYQAVKRVNPDANVAVLGINGSDYFHGRPPFVLSRIVLDDLKDNFDLLAIDAYSGNWNALRGPLDPPENGLMRFLKDAAELSAFYQRPPMVLNAERCYAMDYFSAFDSDTAKTIADYTARSVIINRAAPSPLYSLHVGTFYSLPRQIRKGVYSENKPILDLGAAWKTVFDEKGEERFVPRPAALAFATAARELAFVSDPQELLIGNGIYAYLFTRKNEERVIAVWTVEKPFRVLLTLPERAVHTDPAGNRKAVNAGKIALSLTGSPQYLSLQCRQAEALSMLKSMEIPDLQMFKGNGIRIARGTVLFLIRSYAAETKKGILKLASGKSMEVVLPPQKITEIRMEADPGKEVASAELAVSGDRTYRIPLDGSCLAAARLPADPAMDGSGKWFAGLKAIKLRTPDHIYPKSALVPELNLLHFDGKDISAELYFGWTKQYLCIAAKVSDRIHIQRRHGENIWMDDAFQFVISTRYNHLPKQLRSSAERTCFSASEHNFGLALTERGPVLYCWGGGNAAPGIRNYPMSVKRTGNTTLYEAAVPWKALHFVPRAGCGIRFGAIVMDNNRREDSQAKYWLGLCGGVAGTQDPAEFKTLILEDVQ